MDSRHGAMRWIAVAWAIAGILGLAVRCAAARGDTAPPARMRRNPRVALFGMALCVLIDSVSARAAEPSKSAAAFDHLASLVGDWSGVQSGTEFKVTYTLTSPGCPIGPQVSEQIEEFVGELDGVEEVQPTMTFSPPWTPERMREDAKFALGF